MRRDRFEIEPAVRAPVDDHPVATEQDDRVHPVALGERRNQLSNGGQPASGHSGTKHNGLAGSEGGEVLSVSLELECRGR